MTPTKENPATVEAVNRGNSKVSQGHCSLRKLKFQQFLADICGPAQPSLEMAILIILGGLN